MRATFRTILLWLLLAAIPLQGFASVSMPCSDRLHRPVTFSALTAPTAHHACVTADHGASHHHDHDAANHGCNGSSCCSPIVSRAAPAMRLRDFGSLPIAFVAPHVPDFVPPLPERPPHTSLHIDTVKC
jgi:hypothetical protein